MAVLLSQLALEVSAGDQTPKAVVSQLVLEISVNEVPSSTRVTQVAIERLYDPGPSTTRVTQVAIERLRPSIQWFTDSPAASDTITISTSLANAVTRGIYANDDISVSLIQNVISIIDVAFEPVTDSDVIDVSLILNTSMRLLMTGVDDAVVGVSESSYFDVVGLLISSSDDIVVGVSESTYLNIIDAVIVQGSTNVMVGSSSVTGVGTTQDPETGYYSGTISEIENTTICPGITSFVLGDVATRSECNWIGSFIVKDATGASNPILNKNFHNQQSSVGYDLVQITLFDVESANSATAPLSFTISGIVTNFDNNYVGTLKNQFAIYLKLTNLIVSQVAIEQIGWGDANAIISQLAIEQIGIPTSQARVSQLAVEALKLANFAAVNHVAVEAVHSGTGNIRANHMAVEAIMSAKSTAYITQTAVELLGKSEPNTRVTALAVEIIRQRTEESNAFAFAQQVVVEMFGRPPSKAQVEQVALETLHNNDPNANVEQLSVEIAHNNDRRAEIEQEMVEALHDAFNRNAEVDGVAVEMLVKSIWDPTVSSLVNNPKFHV